MRDGSVHVKIKASHWFEISKTLRWVADGQMSFAALVSFSPRAGPVRVAVELHVDVL